MIDERIKKIINLVSTVSFIIYSAFSVLLIIGYIITKTYGGINFLLALTLYICAYIAYRLTKVDKEYIALYINNALFLGVTTYCGAYWGFDLPAVIIGYYFSVCIVAITCELRQNIYNIVLITTGLIMGQFSRDYFNITNTWKNQSFGYIDIATLVLAFIGTSALMTYSGWLHNNSLKEAVRAKLELKDEKDNIEQKIELKTKELKDIQNDSIANLYTFVEFGKIAKGLFHDLVSPIHNLKLNIDEHYISNNNNLQNIYETSNKLISQIKKIHKYLKHTVKDEEFDIVKDIKDIELLYNYSLKTEKVIYNFSSNIDEFTLIHKRSIILHIINNLISNAIEAVIRKKTIIQNYTPEIDIRIHIDESESKIYISISDNGVGIKDIDKILIFNPYYTTKTNETNCGLGLASVKHFTKKYLMGNIYMEGEHMCGSTFILSFKYN